MIFAISRLILGGALILGVLYLLVSLYARSLRREALEDEWNNAGQPGTRQDYVQSGLTEYNQSLRRKALLLIFIVPPVLVGVLAYVINT